MKISLILTALLIIFTHSTIYDKYYDEAYAVAASMTLDQKIGQTIQVDFYAMVGKNGTTQTDAVKFALGSLLVGGNGCPDENGNLVIFDNLKEDQIKQIYANATVDKWKKFADKFNYSVNILANNGKTYKIKPFLATDAVHGDQHVAGSILFPHNIGLSCAHDSKHFYNAGYWTTNSIKKYGFNYAFAPTVAVSHNPQWGRYYETMGQEHDKIYEYAKAYTEGIQGKPGALSGVMGSVKHFFADGATFYGADEGNAQVGSFKNFVYHNIQGFNGSISSGIGSVMASYSAINYVPLSAGPYLKSILRGDLAYDGFVISDYSEIEKLSSQYLPTSLEVMMKN